MLLIPTTQPKESSISIGMRDQKSSANGPKIRLKQSPIIKLEPYEQQQQQQQQQPQHHQQQLQPTPPNKKFRIPIIESHRLPEPNNKHHRNNDEDDCPQTKRRKTDVDDLLGSLKSMDPEDRLELWKKMINQYPFDLQQLRSLKTAIDNRIRLDIISNVPYEIALYITSFLSGEDLCRAAQTCRSWRVVCEDSRTWREKCREEGLLSDEETLSTLFKKRISAKNSKQEKFVSDFVSPQDVQSKSEWKSAYMKHVNILRNWKTRLFDTKEPYIGQPNKETQSQFGDKPFGFNDGDDGDGDGDDDGRNPDRRSGPNQSYLMHLGCHDEHVITSLQYNPSTNTIVSGSNDKYLKVWSSQTGRCISTLKGHSGGVWASQLSPDGIVISGSVDRTVKIWRASTGKLIHSCVGHCSTVRCLALDGDKVVSGSRDTTLRLWNLKDGNCLQVFVGHSESVRCVEYKDGKIVSGAYDHLVMVWDANTGTCIHALKCHVSRIYSLQFDGKTIASGSLDATICIWDADTGKLRHHLKGHTSLTSKMQLKGNILVSANADSYCKIWDVDTGKCLHTLGGQYKHTSAVTSVCFNNRHVITSSDDGTVKLWDTKTGKFIRNLVVLGSASTGGVVWRIKASYTKLICAVGSRFQTEDTHLLVLDFN